MEVWNPEHPHHAVWREYTQSLLDGKPKVVECRPAGQENWEVQPDPGFNRLTFYRIARPMLKLSYEVPMPVTEPLENHQVFWPGIAPMKTFSQLWYGYEPEKQWLRSGLIYLTESDAQAAIDARNAAMTAALEGAK